MNKQKNVKLDKPKNMKGTVKRLLSYFKPYKTSVIFIVVFAIASTLFTILGPLLLGRATDIIVAGLGTTINFGALLNQLIILGVIYAASSIFSFIQQRLTAKTAQRTIYDLRRAVDQKISSLPLNYFDTHTHGEVLSRTTSDIERIGTTLQQSMTQLITAAATIVGILIMMFTISWIMAIIAVLILPLTLLLTSGVVKRSQNSYKMQQQYLGEVNSFVEEQFSAHNVIKLFRRENSSIKTFGGINGNLKKYGIKAQFASSIIMPLVSFVGNLGYVGVCVAGAVLTAGGNLSIGAIQSFIQYIQQFIQPITQSANIANVLQSSIAAAERVFELLDEEEQVEESVKTKIEKTTGTVTFEHVRFGYVPEKILIKDMNLTVKSGQKVAIVGPTGAGKTTLVNLLMRFYELSGGAIKIDGVNIQDISRDNLRELFGMVLQDTWLKSDTIAHNIAYGDPSMPREQVERAAKMANVDHFISTWPGGYDMVISEDADNISQGQKQLLTIARAFADDPQILILDEATSSVDTRTEQLIQSAMQKLTQGRTSFVIAHRLSTIKDSDIILYMQEGDILEQGSHEELMELNNYYAKLYNSQFA